MVTELNLVVARGSGPARELSLISLNLEGLQRLYPAESITFWLDRFKQTVYEERGKGTGYQEDSRRLKSSNEGRQNYSREKPTVMVDPWNLQRQPSVNNNPGGFSMGQTGGYQQAGPHRESRRDRRAQRDISYSQQLPSPNQGTLMI